VLPDYRTLYFNANVPANSQISIAGSTAIVDAFGNSVTPFTLQYPTGAAPIINRPAVTSISPTNFATGVSPSTPIVLQFNQPMDPQSLQPSVRVTQNGNDISGTLTLSNGNATVQFTPANPYAAGSRIDAFVTETAANPGGLTTGQRFDSSFTVAGTAANLDVEQVSFGSAVAPEAALEVSFSQAVNPRTVNSANVWLRTGQQSIPGTVVLRGDRIIRFISDAPLNLGVDYVLTMGAGLRARTGSDMQPREFTFTTDDSPPPTETETAAIEDGSVHLHFTAPVSPLTADLATAIAADGSEIPVERRISLDFRDLWLIPLNANASLDGAGVSLDHVEDRKGRPVIPWRGRLRASSK
jgi:hypothetical protein